MGGGGGCEANMMITMTTRMQQLQPAVRNNSRALSDMGLVWGINGATLCQFANVCVCVYVVRGGKDSFPGIGV